MPDQDLVQRIRGLLDDSPFHGEGYRKVWARLRHAGVRTSKERVRRLMRENDLAAARASGTPRGPRAHDGRIIPEGVDQMWDEPCRAVAGGARTGGASAGNSERQWRVT